MATLTEPAQSRQELRAYLWWPVLWVVFSGLGAFVLRAESQMHGTHKQLGLPACGLVVLTGRPCPGCGMTTSWTNLLHGHVFEAFQANLLGPFLYLMFTTIVGCTTWAWIKQFRWRTELRPFKRASFWLAIVVIGYGAVRYTMVRYPNENPVFGSSMTEQGGIAAGVPKQDSTHRSDI